MAQIPCQKVRVREGREPDPRVPGDLPGRHRQRRVRPHILLGARGHHDAHQLAGVSHLQ